MLFDESGIINIDETVMKSNSYKKIMEDGIVTDEELQEQSTKISELLKEAAKLPKDVQEFIEKLLVETCVLSAISQVYAKQSEDK